MKNRGWILAVVFSALFLVAIPATLAGDGVRFTNVELQAALELTHPERSVVELDQRTAKFDPAPSLRYFGVPAASKDVDLSVIAKVVDLRFDHMRVGIPTIAFQPGVFQIVVPVADNAKGIRSVVGSIGFQGVSLVANLVWVGTGTQRLALQSVEFRGKLSGKGILGTGIVLNATKKLAVKTLTEAVEKLLARDELQAGIETGLLQYARFNLGDGYSRLEGGSLRFFSEGTTSGLQYAVER